MKLSDLLSVPVHPFADRFPMLPQDRLAELANDISENGLNHPIVLQETEEGPVLIDGRNRLAACALVKVEPQIRWLKGEDPLSVICSENLQRREINTGQRAVLFALAYPEPGKRGRGNKSVLSTDLNSSYLSRARAILKHDDLVQEVLDDTMKLNAAFDEAKKRADKDEAEAKKQRERKEWMERIRAEVPYLADAVDEGKETLEGAIAIIKSKETEEEKKAKNARMVAFDNVSQVIRGARYLAHPDVISETVRVLLSDEYAQERVEWFPIPFTKKEFLSLVNNINNLAKAFK